MNWILPVRATQAVLSIVVLGLMAYGMSSPSPSHTLPHHTVSHLTLTTPLSIVMVVNALAPILAPGDQLPHLRTLVVNPRPCPFPRHLASQVRSPRGET
jgi:hypothetical protein